MEEVWKDVPGYPDYMVSSLGRVKSMKFGKERILKPSLDNYIYYAVNLSLNGRIKHIKIHKIVAMAFLGHDPCGHKAVVDHIDHNPLNNRVDNLRLVSQRKNSSHRKDKGLSKYTGVSWHKGAGKWQASIYIKGKFIHLGYFTDELEAAQAYQKALAAHKNKTNEN